MPFPYSTRNRVLYLRFCSLQSLYHRRWRSGSWTSIDNINISWRRKRKETLLISNNVSLIFFCSLSIFILTFRPLPGAFLLFLLLCYYCTSKKNKSQYVKAIFSQFFFFWAQNNHKPQQREQQRDQNRSEPIIDKTNHVKTIKHKFNQKILLLNKIILKLLWRNIFILNWGGIPIKY